MNNTLCNSFLSGGINSNIKHDTKNDLGIIYSKVPAKTAGVFTKNKILAAPVILDKKRIKSGTCQAIIVNSGNANCCTGEKGLSDAEAMAKITADALLIPEESVLVASTGVIGEMLPMEKIENGIKSLLPEISENDFTSFAESILTTDKVKKIVSVKGKLNNTDFNITGIAKGSGMIRPDMATMLCFVLTDIEIPSRTMQNCLESAVNRSFNRITIDGDTSTNDTVILMANGTSSSVVKNNEDEALFQKKLDDVLYKLAKLIVKDGEGATKLVEIIVKGAESTHDAFKIADTVAHSNLVKTALFGEDANWGRLLMAIGRAGVNILPDSIDIFFNTVQMVKNSTGLGIEAEKEASKVLKLPEFKITIDLNMGNKEEKIITCDFSIDYVKINADYRS